MPHPEIAGGPDASASPASSGFWGKLPSRGDFCGAGLSKWLVSAWDVWVSAGLAASQDALGDRWQPAWMEAPVWCFSASPGMFGDGFVSGVWMPSVDRAGRAFPLLIALEGVAAPGWFGLAEAAGRAALEEGLGPEAFAGRLPGALLAAELSAASAWWTEGSPRVAPCCRPFDRLPAPQEFAAMLEDAA